MQQNTTEIFRGAPVPKSRVKQCHPFDYQHDYGSDL